MDLVIKVNLGYKVPPALKKPVYNGEYSWIRPPLWSSGQSFWLQIQRPQV